MEIEGGGRVHVYGPEDEAAHTPGPQPHWQESVVLIWWDARRGVGGYHRIGHEPIHDGGHAVLWHNLFTPQGVHRRNHVLPLRPEDRLANGFGGGRDGYRFEYDGGCLWTLENEESSAILRLEDFHPSMDGYTKGGTFGDDIAPHHLEVACRVRGTLTLRGSRVEVDGLGMRDHGWGPRHWQAILSHRWAVGVFDRTLSFVAVSFQGIDDRLIKFGWVVRDQRVIYSRALDLVSFIECDGTSNRGGTLRMTLSTGEVFDAVFEPIAPCVMSWHHGMACMDTLCRVRSGDRIGIGDFESSSNALKGERRPAVLDRGLGADGWYPSAGG